MIVQGRREHDVVAVRPYAASTDQVRSVKRIASPGATIELMLYRFYCVLDNSISIGEG
jgi:hypothetical protein